LYYELAVIIIAGTIVFCGDSFGEPGILVGERLNLKEVALTDGLCEEPALFIKTKYGGFQTVHS
jgi:hypothetical protein